MGIGGLYSLYSCYFRLPKLSVGGGCSWDFAATACLYSEVGAWVTDAVGETLCLNRVDSVFMNYCGIVFATLPAIAKQFLALRGEDYSESKPVA